MIDTKSHRVDRAQYILQQSVGQRVQIVAYIPRSLGYMCHEHLKNIAA